MVFLAGVWYPRPLPGKVEFCGAGEQKRLLPRGGVDGAEAAALGSRQGCLGRVDDPGPFPRGVAAATAGN